MEPEGETLSVELDSALADPEFNVVQTINHRFPTEESLSGLEPYLRALRDKIAEMDEGIMIAVRQQATCGNKAQDDLKAAQRAIVDLSSKTADIKKRAEQSEEMVNEICADIKQLDHAKRNLEYALRSLKGLQLIMAAAEQLKELAELNQYRECANLLQAVIPMAKRFEEHKRVTKVRDLLDDFGEMKQSIRAQVFKDLELFTNEDLSPQDKEKFGDACLIVDALGPEAKQDMIAQFSSLFTHKSQFRVYDALPLEKTEKRFTALRKLLQSYEEQYDQVFPLNWKVPQKICEDFCRVTNSHLQKVLKKSGEDGPEVGPLLHVLQKTIEFEQELGERFAEEIIIDESGVEVETEDSEVNELYEELQNLDTTTTAGIRRKYELLRKIETRQKQSDHITSSTATTVRRPTTRFCGMLSNVFEQYMSVYISAEVRNMRQMIARAVAEEKWEVGETGFTKLVDSSAQMFLGIRKSLQRCIALNKDVVLYDMHKDVFCVCLRDYANALRARMSQQGGVDQCIVICLIINTADYCFETCGELAESLKKALTNLNSDWSDQISVANEQAEFRSVQNFAIRELVANLMNQLDKGFTMLARMPWGMIKEVGDHSTYVDEITEVLQSNVPKFGQNLVPAFFNMFCNKFVESFIPKYIDTIFSCKNVDVIAVQQLLLDTGAMRSLLLKIPSMGDATPSNMFTKLTNKDMAKVEDLMKTLMSDKDSMVEVFLTFVTDGSKSDFQRVCELKGLKKLEIETLCQVLMRNPRAPKT